MLNPRDWTSASPGFLFHGRVMGPEAIYPKPRLSPNGSDHNVYPYLLKGVSSHSAKNKDVAP
jgi:hypothetical protein